jgi:hypothetical protein
MCLRVDAIVEYISSRVSTYINWARKISSSDGNAHSRDTCVSTCDHYALENWSNRIKDLLFVAVQTEPFSFNYSFKHERLFCSSFWRCWIRSSKIICYLSVINDAIYDQSYDWFHALPITRYFAAYLLINRFDEEE